MENDVLNPTEVASYRTNNSCWSRFKLAIYSAEFKIYCSYALSSWGQRMWNFTLSIALYYIGDNLQLPAVSNLVNSVAVLIFGAAIGRWIDKTSRLKAARLSLIINNSTVALSAFALFALLYWKIPIQQATGGAIMMPFLIGLSMVLCATGALANTGNKIVVTKDWVVVISGDDRNRLAAMNAMMVRIDMTSMILSPLLAGQIMSSFGTQIACIFVASWTLASLALEFYFLTLVYRHVPELSIKPIQEEEIQSSEFDKESAQLLSNSDAKYGTTSESSKAPPVKSFKICTFVKATSRSMANAWLTYYHQLVFPAAVSLALLFMTVMGLDGITSSYIISQGIKENVLAAARGAGALAAIGGTLMFPTLRDKIGLARTGLYAFSAEILCLTVSLASVWLPGSPFDPTGYFGGATDVAGDLAQNSSVVVDTGAHSLCSVWAFVTGVVLARFGLWLADLTVTQVMQEAIESEERGVVFGVQSAVNQFLSLIKDILVIFLPDPQTFGILIILSYLAIVSGLILFAVYARKVRGHLLPFHRIWNKYKRSKYSLLRDTLDDFKGYVTPPISDWQEDGRISEESYE